MNIDENVQNIKSKINKACSLIGKNPHEIKIVVASKYAQSSQLREVFQAGLTNFGENRVQDLLFKQGELSDLQINWDFIGHLQSNKVVKIVGRVDTIHSVDSLRIAEEISKQANKLDILQSILIQVNSSQESSKSGFSPVETLQLISKIAKLKNIKLIGLMSIAPNVKDEEVLKEHFSISREIFENIKNEIGEDFSNLSMGMSSDFELAINFGANIVRLGSAIFM